jgi:sigma-54 dependent transcriptional regulator, acetoin dehydrogenase operon transcriptional activator AcoR
MEYQTTRNTIPSSIKMREEILASHRRSLAYGICREKRNEHQVKLPPGELEVKRERNRDFLGVVVAHIDEFYELLSPDDFMVAYVDSGGYILHLAGSESIKLVFAERNCSPGYRWTEEDVGTSAISVCLKRQFPIQLNDQDHYCIRAYGFSSSAAPIFGKQGRLAGVLVVSGASSLIHPHTLIMITMAARSIEKHMRLLRRNQEMSLYSGFLDRVIESAETGILTVDREMRIWKTNRKGKQILKQQSLDGKPASLLQGLNLDLKDIQCHPAKWKEREACLQIDKQDIHLYYSAQPVVSQNDKLLGAVMVFEEFKFLRKLADRISGTEPFFTFDLLIGNSRPFKDAVDLAIRASKSSSTVLLLGETGTGKELFAQAIHNGGRRKNQPFVPINCGAIPNELLESELFGYVDGAFTGASKKGRPGKFELADGGTILLDEIGDMPHDMQVKLLRVLQTGEVERIGAQKVIRTDARIIAATHVDLQKAITLKQFRKDLFYRLNIIEITLPSLHERGPEDIEVLALHFIKRYSPGTLLTAEAVDKLVCYGWPGNVRELENTIQRGLHLCDDGKLKAKHIGIQSKSVPAGKAKPGTLREMEQALITTTLDVCDKNMAKAARSLGISRATLYRKVQEYGLAETSP